MHPRIQKAIKLRNDSLWAWTNLDCSADEVVAIELVGVGVLRSKNKQYATMASAHSKVPVYPQEQDEEMKGTDVTVSLHDGKELHDFVALRMKLPDVVKSGEYVCCQPAQVIGIQKSSPVAWSADGSVFVFASRNSSLYLCALTKLETRYEVKLKTILPGHMHEVEFLSFHPKRENFMVSGGRDGIYVWDMDDYSISKRIEMETNTTGDGIVFPEIILRHHG